MVCHSHRGKTNEYKKQKVCDRQGLGLGCPYNKNNECTYDKEGCFIPDEE